MRLKTLTLSHYGNFEDQRVTFDPAPGRVNLLMLPNGGGKSVMRHAFCDLLFGISGQTPFGWRYGYPRMRLMAEALDRDGTPFTFGRRKGQGRTLLDENGQPIENVVIERRLGGVDRSRLNRLFVMDTAELREAEKQLLANNGELGPALVSGGGGVMNLRDVKSSLIEERDGLAPLRRSASRPFYQAADRYLAARRRKDENTLKPKDWEQKQKERDTAQAEQEEANKVIEDALAGMARLERIRRTRAILAELAEAEAWLAAHAHASVLDPGLSDRLRHAKETLAKAEITLDRAKQTVEQTNQALEAVAVDDTLLAEAEAIAHLTDQAGAARKARNDLPRVETERATLAGRIAEALRELGVDLPVERAAEVVPARAAIDRTRRLIQAAAAQRTLDQAAPVMIAQREQERDAVRLELAQLPAISEVSGLQALLREIRADGDPVARFQQVSQAEVVAAEALWNAMSRVPGWTQDAEALRKLSPLPLETFERHAVDLAETSRVADQRAEAMETARSAREKAQERLAEITGPAPLPDANRLAHIRARRDHGWDLIKRRAFSAKPPSAEEEQSFAGPFSLPSAYERAVLEADDMADRRVDQAHRIAEAEAARKEAEETETAFARAEQQLRVAREAQSAARRTWQQVCEPFGLGEQPSIQAVRTFIQARDNALAKRSELVDADLAEIALTQTHLAWADRLRRSMGVEDERLGPLLVEADRRLADAERAGKVQAALAAKLDSVEKQLAEARAQAQRAAVERAAWETEWARAMSDLHRPATEDPETVEGTLRVLAELAQDRREWTDRVARVNGMRADLHRFEADVRSLVERIAPDLAGADPFVATAALSQRLAAAKAADSVRAERTLQAAQAREALQQAEAGLRDASSDRAAILAAIGAHTIEEAEARLLLAQERARRSASLQAALVRLREQGDALPLQLLRAEAEAVPPDILPAQLEALQARVSEARSKAQAAAALAATLTKDLREAEDARIVNEAAVEQQAAAATLGRILEDALVNHIAADLLERAIATVEETEAPEALKHINTLFGALTNGRYMRVHTEPRDDKRAHLVMVQRDYPHEQQEVQQLSEGTRDQLFLALRLAAIEQYVAAAPALPFIGDDILQTFDDERAEAAMRVLCDFSQTVQVILMTHHQHLLTVAERLPAGSVHVCRLTEDALV